METKAFRIDWYPRDSFMDFSELEAEEIGVLMQIINLIYSDNGAIAHDPKRIGKSCSITQAKCQRIILELIRKGHLVEVEPGLLHKKRCMLELQALGKRREKYSENGKKGAEIRWGIEQNQYGSCGQVIPFAMASTSTNQSPSRNTDTSTSGGSARRAGGDLSRFGQNAASVPSQTDIMNIDLLLSDEARDLARQAAPGWSLQELMRLYNDWHNKERLPWPENPDLAFVGWCKKFTKGRKP